MPSHGFGRRFDGLEDVAGEGGAGLAEEDGAVFADDDDGALDAGAVRFDGAVGVGDLAPLVDQEVEGERELLDEGEVALGGIGIDPDGEGIGGAEAVDRRANGGQLVASAGGHVFRVEQEEDVAFAPELAEAKLVASGAAGDEIRGDVTDLDHRVAAPLRRPELVRKRIVPGCNRVGVGSP